MIRRIRPLIWLAGVGAGITVWAYTTFATFKYVDDKHADVQKNISELKDDARDTKSMVMDLYRDELGHEPSFSKRSRDDR